ncbi:lantibiotic dehydratase [Actinocrispum sp. NPDC049592]|uniref:lantibiotic dehydratase n=1 Tax=Actinocrispum sp. NPDC049592 TaxID=3154835 RepID=UPI003426B384
MTSPRVAPFALVRVAALACPPPPDAARGYREAVRSLASLESAVRTLGRELVEALYASASGHSAEFHRRVVLPLRRDVHNGRTPKLTGLGRLADRVPGLNTWLAAQSALAAATETVLHEWPSALAAERATLATVCAAEPLRRAVALSGRDLLYGVERAGSQDRKARKAEATVLRYALRATTKTSPLSWYTYAAWGHWSDVDDLDWGEPVAHAQINQTLLTRLTADVLWKHRDVLPHRLAPGLKQERGRVSFLRDTPVDGSTRAYVTKEERVEMASSGPLRFVIDAAQGEKGITPTDLASALATKLPGDQAEAAVSYVTRLLDAGMLIPVAPVHPHDPDTTWLADLDPDLGLRLDNLVIQTTTFAQMDARDRAARLALLEQSWRDLGVEPAGVTPVAEDVVLPGRARLGPAHGRRATGTLARLTPLMMAFDRQLLVRRLAREKFVAAFGPGGTVRPADCAGLLSEALIEALTSPHAEIDAIRAELAGMMATPGEITDAMIDRAEELLPRWARSRPVSYSWFVQPVPGGLVVNHCYAGFARFTTRFLDHLPGAADDVSWYLDEIFPDGFAQYRPVHGFNPNLQPLLTGTEVGEDPRWADVTPDDLRVHHDEDTDELRLISHGKTWDVLYLGFLMPLMLPDRVAALYTDLSCGWADLSSLQSTVENDGVVEKGRLRYRDVLLARRSWDFRGAMAERLRTGFAKGDVRNALAAARLRAEFDLPEEVFISAGGGISTLEDFQNRLGAPKPQYADLTNALHTRCLHKVFTRHTGDVLVTEAVPAPTGRVLELIAETWWRAP